MNLSKFWHDNKSFIFFVFLLFAVRWSIIDHYRVPTSSMVPSVLIGDQLIVNKMAYDLKVPYTEWVINTFGDPKRGDIVVFEYPVKYKEVNQQIPPDGLFSSLKNYASKMWNVPNYVKRLIAVPGDTVEVVNGIAKVNGEPLLVEPEDVEKITKDLMLKSEEFQYKEKNGEHTYGVNRTPKVMNYNPISITVPEDMYFVMGDNRDQSSDSRSWGFVPRSLFKGKAVRVLVSVTLKDFFKWERTGMKLD